MTDKTKTTLYFLGGAAVGVGIGLLFAPKPGKETREDVKRKLGEFKDKGKELWAKGREQFYKQKIQVGAAIDAGKKAYQEAALQNQNQSPLPVANHKRDRHPVGV